MRPLLEFLDYMIGAAFNLYWWVVLATVIVSWMVSGNVINTYSPFVRSLRQALGVVTEPLLKPIRRRLPDFGGFDLSPIVLLFACLLVSEFLRGVVIRGWLIPMFP